MSTPSTTETLVVPLSASTHAIVTVTIIREGLGHVDPETHHLPTARELDTTTQRLATRSYQFAPR